MRLRLPVTAALVAVLTLGAAAPATEQPTDIDAYLRERTAASETPGVAYAVVTPEAIERVGVWGESGDGEPVTEATPFLWGSVSKPVTATAVMALVEDGAVELDEPVRAHLPDFTLAGGAGGDITVRQLLDQTSGIPGETGVTDRFERRRDPYGEAVAELADVAPLFPPGERFEYSSANYLLLGAVVEAVSGQAFGAYLRERVLDPLDMDGALTSPGEARAAALPDGHGYVYGRPVGVAPRYDETGASYGYLGGTVEDLAHFAMAQLNGGSYGTERVLDADSVAATHSGAARVGDTVRYGLGWRVDERNADLDTGMVWHTGASPGYFAGVVLLPELKRGVVVLGNAYGYFQDAELVGTVLGAARMLAGGQPEPVSGDFTYPLALAVLTAIVLGAAVVVLWSCYRLFRPAAGRRGRAGIVAGTASWALGGLALAHLAVAGTPQALGVGLGTIRLWAPDVGWLLVTVAAAGLAVAATRLVCGCVTLRRCRQRDAGTCAPAR
ncbi:class A beta-lactamase-related serine hydrolase [Streptomyces sp. 8K308]|uniref:serine hydrolase domain-containing protein n=1 Tax=Streptomyces sp. 8K308 TaxID=2530388 RepID=UPI001043FEB1|nr:serine hydrolase domain-containing protein [Streptomyces sp. 8K308]TDC27048.1 class A beta-lactamase-related serine hydrolase [Streptomyces sp. 8K308]